ncbi:putative ribonuclease H-like domain-containing protein [Tanacetum coccineum]
MSQGLLAIGNDASFLIAKMVALLSLLEELARAAESDVTKDQLIVLFEREVAEDVEKVRDFRRLSTQLREVVRRSDGYVAELRALRSCDDDLGTIKMLSRMKSMAKLVRCDELRDTANSPNWEKMMILYCRRSMVEDYRLAGEATMVCGEVDDVAQEKAHFLEYLDLSRLATTLNRLERSIQIGINKWYQSLLRNSDRLMLSDFGIDKSKFTYGPKQSKTSESDAKTSDTASCESNSSVETPDSVSKPAVNEPTVVSKLKVWSDAPIIEEYESDRKLLKNRTQVVSIPKADKRDWNGLMSKKLGLGYGFTKKACFVCGSFSHLIRDCDFHEKRMAKQVELNKQKGKGTGQGENKPVWNNVQRLNHQNKFVPKAVLTKTGIFPVNAARQNPSSQAAETSTARKVNTARPIVNEIRQRNNFYKSHSPIRRPFNKSTAPKANFTNHKVNTAGDKTVSAVRGYRETAVKTSADPLGKPKSAMAWVPKRKSKGIKREYSNARTLQQNGVAERKNKTLIEAARTMLAYSFLPNNFWAEAVIPKEANHSAGTQYNIDAEIEAEPAQEYFVLPLWSSYTSTVKSSEAKNGDVKPNGDTGPKTNEEPKDQEDLSLFRGELTRLKRQENEANNEAEAFRKEFAQYTEDLLLQARAARATSTNTVNTISTPISTASPSNVFSIGGPDLNNNDQDDSQIPALEDTYENQ